MSESWRDWPEGEQLVPRGDLMDPELSRNFLAQACARQGRAVQTLDTLIAQLERNGADPLMVRAVKINRETAYELANVCHGIASTKLRPDPPTNPPVPPQPTLRQRAVRWIVSLLRAWT